MVSLSAIYRRSVLGLGLLASAPACVLSPGRDGAVTPGQSPIQTQVQSIKLSSRLRVTTDTTRPEGRLLFRTADSLGIRGVDGAETRLPLSAVDTMWVRKRQTVLGFLLGAAAGAAGYLIITNIVDDSGSDMSELDNAIGAVLWAGSTLVGTGVGTFITHWKRVHPNF